MVRNLWLLYIVLLQLKGSLPPLPRGQWWQLELSAVEATRCWRRLGCTSAETSFRFL